MNQDSAKQAAARAAIAYVGAGTIVGVGTGSTANHFIDALAEIASRIRGAVASSAATAARLVGAGLPVLELDAVERLPLYVDGADEATRGRQLIKGGGGALTREKIVAAASERFVCILDESKLVERLGAFPVAVEVIPMAGRHVAREIERLGGRPLARPGFVTDNGNMILDVHGLPLDDPQQVEAELNQIAGVVANGLFCRRPADLLLVGTPTTVTRIE